MKNKKKKLLVSIIIPVYNAGEFLIETLQSVFNQTYSNIEVIAYNDCSEDNSFSILKEYQKKESRLSVYSHTVHKGVGETANCAIAKAKGSYIARLDADDLMPVDRIEKQVSFLQTHPKVVVVGGQVELISIDGLPITVKQFPKNHNKILDMSFTTMPIQQGAMMINTKLLPKDFNWYNTEYNTSEDLDLFYRLFEYGKGANISDIILYYRQHGKSITQAENPKEIFFQAYKIRQLAIQKYKHKIPFITRFKSVVQYLLVSILPQSYIYPIYYMWRGLKPAKISLLGMRPLLKHAFSYIL